MSNHSSAKKRTRQTEKRRQHNKSYMSNVKTVIKAYTQQAAEKSNAAELQQTFPKVQSLIHKMAAKGLVHKNNAARKISNLQKLLISK